MGVEYMTITTGVIVLLLGIALMWDAWGPQAIGPMRDRRRRVRTEINLAGEFLAGFGVALLGAAIVARDWRFETTIIFVGTICIVIGVLKNRKYFRELLLFRGSARRDTEPTRAKSVKMRIR